MRPIKFRGALKNSKEWRIGSLLVDGKDYFIVKNDENFERIYPVIKESVGQYTGFKHVDGTEICEKDVLGFDAHIDMVVDYYEGCFVGVSTNKTQRINWRPIPLTELLEKGYEVIGNIYDNPELLKSDTND